MLNRRYLVMWLCKDLITSLIWYFQRFMACTNVSNAKNKSTAPPDENKLRRKNVRSIPIEYAFLSLNNV